jgi:hypothetical protein
MPSHIGSHAVEGAMVGQIMIIGSVEATMVQLLTQWPQCSPTFALGKPALRLWKTRCRSGAGIH